MLDLSNLFAVLPISHLEPEQVAFIEGLTDPVSGKALRAIRLVEPPATQRVPFIDPVEMLAILFQHQGETYEIAKQRAIAEYAALRPGLRLVERVKYFDSCDPNTPECIPLPRLLDHLQGRHLIADRLADFLMRVLDAVSSAAIFSNPDQRDRPWSLATLPDLPPAKAMMEFIPGVPFSECDLDEDQELAAVAEWHTTLRPITERLESALSQKIYHFRDLDDEYGDDYGHRFLVLYYCCLYQPESDYVKFLMEACGTEDVEALKAALIDPANYRHPFEMNYTSCDDYETCSCRFRYQSPGMQRAVGIVFSSLAARAIAEVRLSELIDAKVWIIAPKALAPDDWIKKATRHCPDWVHQYLRDDLIAKPITLLARLDELYVISNDLGPCSGADLGVSPSIQELLWYAHILKVPTRFLYTNGTGLWNPEDSLKTGKIPERVAEHARRREAFTRELTDIRLWVEYTSSGLWNSQGQMLGYDDLAIPFSLVRRIAAWQDGFEDNNDPPATADDDWWDRHEQEAAEIAQAIHEALGSGTRIRFYRNQDWQVIGGNRE